nr:reverse transcriptase domain-containing protein [Tanacetum cinerariifolium]
MMVGGRPFIIEHRLNEFKHIEPRKQKKRGLAPERSKALHTEEEELTKSESKEAMLADIQETFDKLRAINMKLNPRKCSFIVEEGPFLAYLITKQGIIANPLKVKAISNLKPPKTIKEIQSLNEKLTALSRFLPKGTDKTLPFLKVLKNCASNKIVQWTHEAEKVFQNMKEYIETLPMVTAPIKGETLVLYLAVYEESISAVLLAERGKKQILIYFNEDLDPKNTWMLYTDEASSSDGFEAGLILVNPKGRKYTYTLRFKFETTNNEVEYVVLLAGLRIIKEMKIEDLDISVDYQLVANQDPHKQRASLRRYIRFLQNACRTSISGIQDYKDRIRYTPAFTSVYHPQENRNVKVANRFVNGMEQRLGRTHQGWVDELPQVLLAHRTILKASNRETPFTLVYGSQAIVPIKISVETKRIKEFEARQIKKRRREDLNILKERKEIASTRKAYYKQKPERYYNKRV